MARINTLGGFSYSVSEKYEEVTTKIAAAIAVNDPVIEVYAIDYTSGLRTIFIDKIVSYSQS